MAQVKTYRSTHTDVLKVGELEINPGELVPEAAEWDDQTVQTLIRVRRLEVVWMDQEAFDQELAERNERLDYYPDEDEKEEPAPDSEEGSDSAGEDPESTSSETPEKEAPKKRIVRKKGKTDGNEPAKLHEQSV